MTDKKFYETTKKNIEIIATYLNARVGNIPIPNILGTEGEQTTDENRI